MKKLLFLVLIAAFGFATIVNAGTPQVINLTIVYTDTPLGGPQPGTGTSPECYRCFAATLTDNVLNVFNRSDEEAVVVITDVDTESVVLSTDLADELEQMLPAGNYQVEIIPENYAPLQGFFEVE